MWDKLRTLYQAAISRPHRFSLALALIVLGGGLLRLALIVRSGWRVDYDEAMIGLLGMHVLRGQWIPFLPAQRTLGTIEPLLLAPVFAVLGANRVTFRLISLVLASLYVLTTGWVGRAAFGERVGALAALLAAFGPPYLLIASLKTWGATIETILLGNLLMLLTAYAAEEARTPRQRLVTLAAAGLIAGVMFWIAWLGVFYFIAVGLIVLLHARRIAAHAWAALLAFALGSAPFWVYTLFMEPGTGLYALTGSSAHAQSEWVLLLAHSLIFLAPRLVTGISRWWPAGRHLEAAMMALYYPGLLVVLLAPFGVWRSRPGSLLRQMLAVFVLAVPLVYLFSSYSRNALIFPTVDATGRYVVMIHTALPLGVAATAAFPKARRGRVLGAALVGLIVGLNLTQTAALDPVAAFDSPYYAELPESLDPLIAYLDEQDVLRVWTDVGIAYVLMFETHERILAADYYNAYIAGGLVRFPEALAAVEAAERVAFVVPVRPDQEDIPLQRVMDGASVRYSMARVLPSLVVFIPDGPLDPAVIAGGLGPQFFP
jgi:hypothetical protein